jgi:hypothetical protein
MITKPFLEISGENVFFTPFDVKPIEGYEPTKDFPNCCAFHKRTQRNLEKFIQLFPNCCEPHKKLPNKKWYNKTIYENVPTKVMNQISFTEHVITQKHNEIDWFKDITDYIEYNVHSLGHPAIGLNHYLMAVKSQLESENWIVKNRIPFEKAKPIIEFIDNYYKEPTESHTDVNVLIEIYHKWLKIFPFNISYFTKLKERFSNQLPILKGQFEVNKYSGITKAKIHSKASLIDTLINLTNDLLTQLNGLTLFEKGKLSNTDKIKLELCIESRRLKLQSSYKSNSTIEEQRYRKILKEWFKDEKDFINEIAPLLNNPQMIKKQNEEKFKIDSDFIRGEIELKFVSQGQGGYFDVTKEGVTKRFSLEDYFDLELRIWEHEIDKATKKKEKLQIANNGIFKYRKDWLDFKHPQITALKEEKIKHLGYIIEYINSFEDEDLKVKTNTSNPNKEVPENPFPTIFKNGYAYQMFLKLKATTVIQRSELADYSFIFNKMKNENFIIKDTKHKTFIEFLNKNCEANISAPKFQYKNQRIKEPAYNTILNEFQPLIKSVP